MNSNKSFEYYSRPSQRNYVSLRRSEQISHRPSDLLNNPRWCRVGIYWSSLARMIWFTLWRFALITLITKKQNEIDTTHFYFVCSLHVRFLFFVFGISRLARFAHDKLRKRLPLSPGNWISRYLGAPDVCDKGNFARMQRSVQSFCCFADSI